MTHTTLRITVPPSTPPRRRHPLLGRAQRHGQHHRRAVGWVHDHECTRPPPSSSSLLSTIRVSASVRGRVRMWTHKPVHQAWHLQACPRTSTVQRSTIRSRDVLVQRACMHASVKMPTTTKRGWSSSPARAPLPDAPAIAAADVLALDTRGIATAASTAGAAYGGSMGGETCAADICAGLRRAVWAKTRPRHSEAKARFSFFREA
jgi:hypothetical protein